MDLQIAKNEPEIPGSMAIGNNAYGVGLNAMEVERLPAST
jgi:hypothetical protein